ncbi:LPS export ABC transporter periplasmic protein LptC [Nitratireductor luteus]|uniref:LPS export ABC transporter periplasmic protein LptC n=1 Tax=Nitratireductor luteus TaxID=2976980 RepID=UPI002240D577|nr:LPS export ABC transporter periplasmic protein LptC [Nitratireductor luteus]
MPSPSKETQAEQADGERRARAFRPSERGAEAFAQAARHSRNVRVLKFVLPTTAAVVAVVFLGYSLLSPGGMASVDLGSASIENGKLVMSNPSLDGFTNDNLPYHMTATRARQAIGSETAAIELEGIEATVPIDNGNSASISAEAGTFDRQGNALSLDTAITLETTSGIRARLSSADIDIAAGTLSTDDPVAIELNGMSIEADAFRASDGGKKLVFDRRVRVTLDPENIRRAQGEPQQ